MNISELFSLDLPTAAYILTGTALAVAAAILGLLLPRIGRVTRRVREDTSMTEDGAAEMSDAAYPPVSVIVTTAAESANLELLLGDIFAQDYPAPVEVIVVTDGDEPDTEAIVSRMQREHTNLYMTFTPSNSRNLSRKKLAVTLGVKASRYEMLLFTCGHCRLRSAMWIRSMMRHMARGAEVVLGYSVATPTDDEAAAHPGRRLRAFDRVRTSLEWLGAAIAHRPYRGDGNNLAYTRRLFYDNNGFADSLTYVNGDDDIFISRVSTRRNTSVELSQDAMVMSMESDPSKSLRDERDARRFTGRHLSRRTPLMWGFISLLWWIWLALSVAAIVTGLPSLVTLAAVTVVSLGLCLPVMIMWKHASGSLLSRKLCVTVVWFIMIHPLMTLVWRMRRSDIKNYSWQ